MDYLRLFDWVWQTSARVSVLVILLLLVKTVLKTRISARLHYLLWSIVIIGLLLPWTPHSSFSLYNLTNFEMQKAYLSPVTDNTPTFPRPGSVDVGLTGEETDNNLDKIAVPQNPRIILNSHESQNPIATSPLTHRLLFFIWLMGVAAFVAAIGLVNRRFVRRIQGQSVVNSKLLSAFIETKSKLNIRAEIHLIQSTAVTSPSLYGLFRPRLLIPVGILEEFNTEQLRYVFVHELLHFKRKDILVNWVTEGLLFLHWFNPILWYAFYKLREDQEIACDAKTIESIGINDSKEYAYTLIKLAESNSRLPKTVSLVGLVGTNSQIRRRITMLKVFRKVPLKWSLLVVTVVAILAFVTLTNAKAETSNTAGSANLSSSSTVEAVATVTNAAPGNQLQSDQLVFLSEGSFNYQTYLSFTPLLPSYTAGYELTYSQICCNQNIPPGNNSNTYLAAYGSHSAFTIREARPNEIHPSVFAHATKTQIQIGDMPVTIAEDKNIDTAAIQFTKNNVEYTVSSIPGGGVSLDELKRISTSIAVPADTPPTEIHIDKMGLAASEGLSFKTLQPGDIIVPQGYKFQKEFSNIYIKGYEKSETFSLYYTIGTSTPFLNVRMSKGDHPFGELGPVLTLNSGFDTKQIDGTEVKLRNTQNNNLPAAQFTVKNGLLFTIYSPDLPEYEMEKVVTSILQASSKL
ncbi:MAG: M56 family metallopeptidase [Desulfosporosinus sp.]